MLVVEFLEKMRPYRDTGYIYKYWDAVEWEHVECSSKQAEALKELVKVFPKANLIEYFSIHDNYYGKISLNNNGEWIHTYTVKAVVDLCEIRLR